MNDTGMFRLSTRRDGLRLFARGAGAAGLLAGAGALPTGALPFGTPAVARAQGTEPSAVVYWNNVALDLIRHSRPAPTVVARALAILHTAIYEAWAAYSPAARPVTPEGRTLKRPVAEGTAPNRERAIAYAAFNALADLFPYGMPALLKALDGQGHSALDAITDARSLDPATPAGVGNSAAVAVVGERISDGANQTGDTFGGAPYTDTQESYQPVNPPDVVLDPNRWQPLQISVARTKNLTLQACTTPHWGRVTPFALSGGAQLRPGVLPPRYPDPGYAAQAQEVLDLSAGLTDRHKAIAEYWSDGPSTETPPGHWCLIAQDVSRRDGHTLEQDVQLFFVLTNALLDASIASWDCKMELDFVRPITAIRYLFAGREVAAWGGPGLGQRHMDGKDWLPYQAATVVTPPFPECVSGHSTFSAAGAEVLRRFTGSDRYEATFTMAPGASRIEPGRTPAEPVTLLWSTFTEMADQAGMSRRYGGIHFETGDLEGRKMGRRAGELVWDKALSLFGPARAASR